MRLPWWTRIAFLLLLIVVLWLASQLLTPQRPREIPSDGAVRATPDWNCVFGKC